MNTFGEITFAKTRFINNGSGVSFDVKVARSKQPFDAELF